MQYSIHYTILNLLQNIVRQFKQMSLKQRFKLLLLLAARISPEDFSNDSLQHRQKF